VTSIEPLQVEIASARGTPADGWRSYGNYSASLLGGFMADPHEFLENWVRESVQATPHRNKAEARRLTYECRKAAERANLSWFAVAKAADGDVEGYVLTALSRAA
jgi:hypothetical protein